MSLESANYTQYYDQANFFANKRWERTPKNFGRITYPIPLEIQERNRQQIQFRQISPLLEFGHWEGIKPIKNYPYLEDDVFIARNPEFPLQRIVGPAQFISNVMFAYYLLDKLNPGHPFRHMDLVASVKVIDGTGENNPTELMWTEALLEDYKINSFKKSQFRKQKENTPGVGIYCDTDWPTFFMYHYDGNNALSHVINSIRTAEAIAHDWTHKEQERLGYTSLCRSAEIQALSNQLRLAESFFNHPGFFRPDPFTELGADGTNYIYVERIRKLLSYLDSFKNDGEGHLLQSTVNPKKRLYWYDKNRNEGVDNNFLPIFTFR